MFYTSFLKFEIKYVKYYGCFDTVFFRYKDKKMKVGSVSNLRDINMSVSRDTVASERTESGQRCLFWSSVLWTAVCGGTWDRQAVMFVFASLFLWRRSGAAKVLALTPKACKSHPEGWTLTILYQGVTPRSDPDTILGTSVSTQLLSAFRSPF